MLLEQTEPRIICTTSDNSQRQYAISVDGQQLAAFSTLLENLDLLYKLFWVFHLEYTPSLRLLFQFIDCKIFGKTIKVANCVKEHVSVL